jgi:hypothetical protein
MDQEGVDVEDDDTQEQPQPEHLGPIDAYNRALTAFDVELEDLHRALANRDHELLDMGASNAVELWLTMNTAHKRLAPMLDSYSDLASAAQQGVIDRYEALVAVLDLASAAFDDSTLRVRLARLRRGLEIAHG